MIFLINKEMFIECLLCAEHWARITYFPLVHLFSCFSSPKVIITGCFVRHSALSTQHSEVNLLRVQFLFVFVCLSSRCQGAWLARLEEHATLDLRVVSSCPTFGCRDYLSEQKLKKKKKVVGAKTVAVRGSSNNLWFLK